MNVIQTTKIFALELWIVGYFKKAERLRQGLSKMLSKNLNKKDRNSLTIGGKKSNQINKKTIQS